MKLKIGVFFGGASVEHEVSVISALQAINNMDKEKYDIIPIYISKENYMYVGEKIGDIKEYKNIEVLIKKSQRVILVNEENQVKIIKYPLRKLHDNFYDYLDLAFPIVHGTNVEDGALQGFFKTLKLPFVGPDVTSSAIGMDKYIMKTVLKDNNIPVLDCVTLNKREYIENKERIIKRIEGKEEYPVIVKPINLGSSVGIKIARDRKELEEALEFAMQYSYKVLVEKAITNLREINCSVIGDYNEAIASECEEPIGTDEILSYEDKYLGEQKGCGSKGMSSLQRKLPAEISMEMKEKIQTLAIETFKLLGCNGVSRIDFIINKDTDEIFVNEINTIPGSLSFYLWEPVGLKYKDLLDKIIDLALKKQIEEKNITYDFNTNILSNAEFGGMKGSKF